MTYEPGFNLLSSDRFTIAFVSGASARCRLRMSAASATFWRRGDGLALGGASRPSAKRRLQTPRACQTQSRVWRLPPIDRNCGVQSCDRKGRSPSYSSCSSVPRAVPRRCQGRDDQARISAKVSSATAMNFFPDSSRRRCLDAMPPRRRWCCSPRLREQSAAQRRRASLSPDPPTTRDDPTLIAEASASSLRSGW